MNVRVLLVATALAVAACQSQAPPQASRFEGKTMGTTYVVQISDHVPESDHIALSSSIQETLEVVNRAMSTYREDSEVSLFNRAPVGVAVPLSEHSFKVFREAAWIAELTDGAFDITVRPLVRLWGFGAGASNSPQVPSDETIALARELVGSTHVRLDDEPPSVTKDADGVECDLSAIAKGYAVDQVAELLSRRGSKNFMVEVGGEVRTMGKNAAQEPWRIGIEKPLPGARELQRTLPLSGLSLATSGDYRNFYEKDGQLYSHLIDPRKGRPVSHRLASVSVVEPTCMRADALASGLLVLGPDEGFELAVREDLAVLFLLRTADGDVEERPTPAFETLFF